MKRNTVNIFQIVYELIKIVDKPTRVPEIGGHHANILDIFFTPYPVQSSADLFRQYW